MEKIVVNHLPEQPKQPASGGGVKAAPAPASLPSKPPVPFIEMMASTRAIRKTQLRLERILLGSVVGFIAVVGVSIYYSEGAVFDVLVDTIRMIESQDYRSSKNRAINCEHPKNKNHPYCQERLGKIEETWRSIMRHQRGESPPFGLGSEF